MQWIYDYDLFLFDFDGLLVNTEKLHYRAYCSMLENRGFDLGWDFTRYIQAAHYRAEGLEEQIYRQLPALYNQEPNWKILYEEKKRALLALFCTGEVELMPGVERLLKALADAQIRRCVVTHSDEELVSIIHEKNRVLHTIPNWITRHDYTHPKPDPECYRKAIEMYGEKGDRVIGFEDSPRGLKALMGTDAQAVFVTDLSYPETDTFLKEGVLHFNSLSDLPDGKVLHAGV